jgi:two-component system, NarL family, nitrate/nitrite response regulator NarL
VRQVMSTVIVGRRALLREGITSLLHDSHYKVIAGVSQASELKDVRIPAGRRILVIFQMNGLQPEGSGGNFEDATENIRLLRSLFPDCKVVVVAETGTPVDLQQIMALAPDGYVLNLGCRDILLKVLELILLDQQAFVLVQPSAPPITGEYTEAQQDTGALESFTRSDADRACIDGSIPPEHQLSPREQQILAFLAQGEPNKAIARQCNITESTVKVHLKAILRKIDAHNRTQAAIWAVANGYRCAIIANIPFIETKSSTPEFPRPRLLKS